MPLDVVPMTHVLKIKFGVNKVRGDKWVLDGSHLVSLISTAMNMFSLGTARMTL